MLTIVILLNHITNLLNVDKKHISQKERPSLVVWMYL